jgi:hypothetical protein
MRLLVWRKAMGVSRDGIIETCSHTGKPCDCKGADCEVRDRVLGRRKLIEQITVDVEFTQAAEEYFDAVLENIDALEVRSLRNLMRLRERCLVLRRMQKDNEQ